MSICPRCGALGYRSVERRGGRYYVYYIHYDPVSKSRRRCYIGPVEGYNHAEHIHMLDLDNLESVDYLKIALNAVNAYVRRARRSEEARREAVERLSKLVEYIQQKIGELKMEN
ncbi:MAG: hypothetical protein QXT64_04235 [Desulfurococcaceae archaeon]